MILQWSIQASKCVGLELPCEATVVEREELETIYVREVSGHLAQAFACGDFKVECHCDLKKNPRHSLKCGYDDKNLRLCF